VGARAGLDGEDWPQERPILVHLRW
jgi:hypothetical protein